MYFQEIEMSGYIAIISKYASCHEFCKDAQYFLVYNFVNSVGPIQSHPLNRFHFEKSDVSGGCCHQLFES